MKGSLPGLRRLAFALLLVLAAPAIAHERGDRDRGHGHDPAHHGPITVPAGVVVPGWDELTPQQREHLGHHKDQWDSLPASRRVHLLERAERRARWAAMPPEERERIRKGMRNYRDLSPEQREQARRAMRAMHALPAAERDALRKQWRAMSPEQRRAWLETGGPGLSPPPETGAD
ncbi:DUF3106 domain-containing protein [Arenimonas sp.]|uniref:DUF3106 domain-containing protein n=1 Tax=Arenimonas sp. TaxID=1872635 RepID=UPI0035B30B3F